MKILEKLLRHLEVQTDPVFEVIVVMDGCTDGSQEMLEDVCVNYNLKWLNTGFAGYGLAIARNRGVLCATGDLVAIIDDDSFPVPDYVAALKRSSRRKTITAGPRNPSDPSEVRQVWKMSELSKLPVCTPLTIEDLRSTFPLAVTTECNICMYRDDMIDIGLFSERLKIYGFIGQEFFERARHFGVKYQYDPLAEIIHDRQFEGAEGLNDGRKRRQTMIATALRPAFMKQTQYALQRQWAVCMAEKCDRSCPLPPFPMDAIVLFPFRFLRNRLGDIRRAIRDRWIRKGT